MTLLGERMTAIKNTRRFLLDLLNPKDTPNVPLKIRRQARDLLKHYPSSFDVDCWYEVMRRQP